MAYYPQKHGRAEYGGYMQVDNDLSITEGDDSVPLEQQRYARLVYQVNPTTIALSGATIGASVGIDGTGAVHVTSNQLMVSDATVATAVDELIVSNTYSKLVISNATYRYDMYAAPGSLSGNAVWRISRTDAGGSRLWADGNANFDNVASNYSGLTYTL